jgi:hypothetical protein
MTNPEYVTLEEKHIGRKVFRAFGRRWRLNSRIRRQDVGCRVYRVATDEIEIERAPIDEIGDFPFESSDNEHNPQSQYSEFITVEPQHVGHWIISAFGSHWSVGRPIQPSDIGKRLYLNDARSVEVDPGPGTPADGDLHPRIFELCRSLGVELLSEICDDTYALGHPCFGEPITPWFETIDELEQFCKANIIEYLNRRAVV